MDIIDRPLSEIIKEQKIGESLRKSRRAGHNNNNNNNNNTQRGAQSFNSGQGRNGRGRNPREQKRRRLPMRGSGSGAPRRRFGLFNGSRRNRNNNNIIDTIRKNNGGLRRRRYAMDIIDERRDRSVKSLRSQRRGPSAFERNERLRTTRRRDAIARARSRFSRD
ncbi:hypothetical protein LSM04_000982 [Trypanosoma melophagium]|uniref:uncharacterized protein n=1 Tax=Trypanosoma melophagium TaxID=715481 RepID=UPI00351A4CD5|nr:hypothetical protein LSM04_000982 [Trypanosoma melophagium]